MPINSRSSRRQATPVVPLPIHVSKTCIFGSVYVLIKYSNNATGFCVGCNPTSVLNFWMLLGTRISLRICGSYVSIKPDIVSRLPVLLALIGVLTRDLPVAARSSMIGLKIPGPLPKMSTLSCSFIGKYFVVAKLLPRFFSQIHSTLNMPGLDITSCEVKG